MSATRESFKASTRCTCSKYDSGCPPKRLTGETEVRGLSHLSLSIRRALRQVQTADAKNVKGRDTSRPSALSLLTTTSHTRIENERRKKSSNNAQQHNETKKLGGMAVGTKRTRTTDTNKKEGTHTRTHKQTIGERNYHNRRKKNFIGLRRSR